LTGIKRELTSVCPRDRKSHLSELKALGLIALPQTNRVKLVEIDALEELPDGKNHEH
jgi:hypothetical protein